MTTKQIAEKLVSLCRESRNKEAIEELFAEKALSIENDESMGPKLTEGKSNILLKHDFFNDMVEEFYGQEISDPIVGGKYFSVSWMIDVKMKGEERMQMSEICVYHIEEGKIVSEQFFY